MTPSNPQNIYPPPHSSITYCAIATLTTARNNLIVIIGGFGAGHGAGGTRRGTARGRGIEQKLTLIALDGD